MKTVEQELREATNQKPQGKKETETSYKSRIISAIADLSDAEYDVLSKESQAWFSAAAEALNESPSAPEKIPPFPELAAEEEAGDESDGALAAEEEEKEEKEKKKAERAKKKKVPATPAKKTVAINKPKQDEVKPTKGEKKKEAAPKVEGKKERRGSVADTIRYAMCENPSLNKEGVAKILTANKLSFDQGRLDQVFSATARVLQILDELKS